jgi:hypothetical protein
VDERPYGALLTSAEVREVLGGSPRRVSELLEDRCLIGVRDSANKLHFPAFQFDEGGRPLEPLVEAFWTVADAAASRWTALSWCVEPDDALDGDSPIDWALARHDADRLATVARQDAARLAR